MSKVKIVCNHCGEFALWYKTMINEVGMYRIGEKIYCTECIKEIAHYGVDL